MPARKDRRKLKSVALEGGLLSTRRFLTWTLIVAAAVGAVGYVLPAHRVERATELHSNYADGGPVSLVLFAAIIAIVFALRRPRLGAGIATGLVAAVGGILAIAPVLLAHFLSSTELAYGQDLLTLGVLGLFFVGLALAIAEPLLYLAQRRALEKRDPPQLPEARALA